MDSFLRLFESYREYIDEATAKVPMTVWITYGIPGEFEKPIIYGAYDNKAEAEREARKKELKVFPADISLPR